MSGGLTNRRFRFQDKKSGRDAIAGLVVLAGDKVCAFVSRPFLENDKMNIDEKSPNQVINESVVLWLRSHGLEKALTKLAISNGLTILEQAEATLRDEAKLRSGRFNLRTYKFLKGKAFLGRN